MPKYENKHPTIREIDIFCEFDYIADSPQSMPETLEKMDFHEKHIFLKSLKREQPPIYLRNYHK